MTNEWEHKKLGDVALLINGDRSKNYPSANEFVENGIPFVNAGHLKNEQIDFSEMDYISKGKFDTLKAGKIKKNDILFCLRGSLGKSAISVIDEGAIASSLVIIRCHSVDTNFLHYYLTSNYVKRLIARSNNGSSQPNLSASSISSFLVPIPTPSEQKQIVENLDLLSKLINKQREQVKELDNLAQSLFINMFGTPIKNERNWNCFKLKQISSLITNGNTPKGGSEVYVDDGILFFRSQNVWRNRIDYEDIAHIDAETNQKLKNSILQHNDILITKTGRINTENSSLGRAALFDGESGSANINGHVYLIRLKEGINHQFVLRILISEEYREYIRSVCVGGIDKRQINKEHVEDFPIILPPIELQNEFAEKIAAIESQKQSITRSIKETQKLFEYAMDKYFG